MERGEQGNRRLVQFSGAADGSGGFPTAGMRQQSVMEALDALIDEGMITIRFENRGRVMSIRRTAQYGQTDIADVHVQAVLAIVEQAKAVKSFRVT